MASDGERKPAGSDAGRGPGTGTIPLGIVLFGGGGLAGAVAAAVLNPPVPLPAALTAQQLTVVTALLQALLVLFPLWLGVADYIVDRAETAANDRSDRRPLHPSDANVVLVSFLLLFFLVDATATTLLPAVPTRLRAAVQSIGILIVITSAFALNRIADTAVEGGWQRSPRVLGAFVFSLNAIVSYYFYRYVSEYREIWLAGLDLLAFLYVALSPFFGTVYRAVVVLLGIVAVAWVGRWAYRRVRRFLRR